METLTINLSDETARRVKMSADREGKSISEWIEDRIVDPERETAMTAIAARAATNGYPAGWLELYGSLADIEGFAAPARSGVRLVEGLSAE